MEEKMVRKVPGCSSAEANVEVFEFVVGDWSHVFMDDIMLVSLPIDKHLKSHWFDRDDCHRRQFQKSEKPKFVNNLDIAPLKLSMLLSKPESLLLDSRTKREVVRVVVWMSLLALINDWSTMDSHSMERGRGCKPGGSWGLDFVVQWMVGTWTTLTLCSKDENAIQQ
ncbi:hypothetical protein ACFX1Q_047290 [Malus domestica]